MTSTEKGFTLIELLVVIAMLAVIIGAISTSVTAAQQRARIQKATADVKTVSQAILAYENYGHGGRYELPLMNDAEADSSSLAFLVGEGGAAESGGNIPALLMTAARSGTKLRDPWGTPYRITIKKGGANVRIDSASGTMKTGFYLPNWYHLTEAERK